MSQKIIRGILIAAMAVSIVLILWITLFSRIGNESRHFYPPFLSYAAIAQGNSKALFEVLGNILLFVPVGIITGLILHLNIKQTLIVGLSLSLIIESCQWFFWLGTFEIDDLVHNTLGAVLGMTLAKRIPPFHERKTSALLLISVVVVIILIGFGYQGLRHHTMVRYAAMNDNGKKNLLVLSPDPKYIGKPSLFSWPEHRASVHALEHLK